MDDRPSLADLHVDLLLLPFPQPASRILMELRADMREVSIMRLGIYRLCRENSQVGCQKGEEGVKMRHSRMCKHLFVGTMSCIEKEFGRCHYMCDLYLDIRL